MLMILPVLLSCMQKSIQGACCQQTLFKCSFKQYPAPVSKKTEHHTDVPV